jgi:formylglycine-generating enzyme required for sulfatase activity
MACRGAAGEEFRDCADCPEMVVIPAGSFIMGSPETEDGRSDAEGPQHRVRIESFALGKYPVTFAEYDACVQAGGCRHRPNDQGWGRGRRPVINVSWNDSQAYVKWLSKKTGKAYRLPSEAEWEYACRAGTDTAYAQGEAITEKDANFGRSVGKTTEVGSYPSNPWKLYDLHGNVWERVEDVWHENYVNAPDDGSAWTEGGSRARVLRGGSWFIGSWSLRAADRYWDVMGYWDHLIGFRVARTLQSPGSI